MIEGLSVWCGWHGLGALKEHEGRQKLGPPDFKYLILLLDFLVCLSVYPVQTKVCAVGESWWNVTRSEGSWYYTRWVSAREKKHFAHVQAKFGWFQSCWIETNIKGVMKTVASFLSKVGKVNCVNQTWKSTQRANLWDVLKTKLHMFLQESALPELK